MGSVYAVYERSVYAVCTYMHTLPGSILRMWSILPRPSAAALEAAKRPDLWEKSDYVVWFGRRGHLPMDPYPVFGTESLKNREGKRI